MSQEVEKSYVEKAAELRVADAQSEDPAAHKEDTGYDEDRMENPDRHLTRIEDDNLINFMDVKNEENPEDNVHARYKYQTTLAKTFSSTQKTAETNKRFRIDMDEEHQFTEKDRQKRFYWMCKVDNERWAYIRHKLKEDKAESSSEEEQEESSSEKESEDKDEEGWLVLKHLAYPQNDKPATVIPLKAANKVSCLTMPLNDKRTMAIGYIDGHINFLDLVTGKFTLIQEKMQLIPNKPKKDEKSDKPEKQTFKPWKGPIRAVVMFKQEQKYYAFNDKEPIYQIAFMASMNRRAINKNDFSYTTTLRLLKITETDIINYEVLTAIETSTVNVSSKGHWQTWKRYQNYYTPLKLTRGGWLCFLQHSQTIARINAADSCRYQCLLEPLSFDLKYDPFDFEIKSDGRLLVSGDKKFQIWANPQDGPEQEQATHYFTVVRFFILDDKHFIALCANGTRLYNFAELSEPEKVLEHGYADGAQISDCRRYIIVQAHHEFHFFEWQKKFKSLMTINCEQQINEFEANSSIIMYRSGKVAHHICLLESEISQMVFHKSIDIKKDGQSARSLKICCCLRNVLAGQEFKALQYMQREDNSVVMKDLDTQECFNLINGGQSNSGYLALSPTVTGDVFTWIVYKHNRRVKIFQRKLSQPKKDQVEITTDDYFSLEPSLLMSEDGSSALLIQNNDEIQTAENGNDENNGRRYHSFIQFKTPPAKPIVTKVGVSMQNPGGTLICRLGIQTNKNLNKIFEAADFLNRMPITTVRRVQDLKQLEQNYGRDSGAKKVIFSPDHTNCIYSYKNQVLVCRDEDSPTIVPRVEFRGQADQTVWLGNDFFSMPKIYHDSTIQSIYRISQCTLVANLDMTHLQFLYKDALSPQPWVQAILDKRTGRIFKPDIQSLLHLGAISAQVFKEDFNSDEIKKSCPEDKMTVLGEPFPSLFLMKLMQFLDQDQPSQIKVLRYEKKSLEYSVLRRYHNKDLKETAIQLENILHWFLRNDWGKLLYNWIEPETMNWYQVNASPIANLNKQCAPIIQEFLELKKNDQSFAIMNNIGADELDKLLSLGTLQCKEFFSLMTYNDLECYKGISSAKLEFQCRGKISGFTIASMYELESNQDTSQIKRKEYIRLSDKNKKKNWIETLLNMENKPLIFVKQSVPLYFEMGTKNSVKMLKLLAGLGNQNDVFQTTTIKQLLEYKQKESVWIQDGIMVLYITYLYCLFKATADIRYLIPWSFIHTSQEVIQIYTEIKMDTGHEKFHFYFLKQMSNRINFTEASDLLRICLQALYIVMTVFLDDDDPLVLRKRGNVFTILVVTSWIGLFTVLRQIPQLSEMLQHIEGAIIEVRWYIIAQLIMLLAATMALVKKQGEEGLTSRIAIPEKPTIYTINQTIFSVWMSQFPMAFGDFGAIDDIDPNDFASYLFALITLIISFLVMMNLMVGIISESVTKIYDSRVRYRYFVMAENILAAESLLFWKQYREDKPARYICYFDEAGAEEADLMAGRLTLAVDRTDKIKMKQSKLKVKQEDIGQLFTRLKSQMEGIDERFERLVDEKTDKLADNIGNQVDSFAWKTQKEKEDRLKTIENVFKDKFMDGLDVDVDRVLDLTKSQMKESILENIDTFEQRIGAYIDADK